MSSAFVIVSTVLQNEAGLHARPSVRLTQLAKHFEASVEVGVTPEGPWIDAKSPVKLMRLKAQRGTTLFVRAGGEDAEQAAQEIVSLIAAHFTPRVEGPGGVDD